MKSLNEDLKNQSFSKLYLLYGEEEYLKKQYRDKLKEAIIPEEGSMNYSYFEGKDCNLEGVKDMADTMPFFAERRLIVMENTGLFKKANPEFAAYIENMPNTTHLLFVETEIDKRGKLYKIVQKNGSAVELARQNEQMLTRWIAGKMKQEGKEITAQLVQYFLIKIGNDMEQISKEIEKLCCYCMDKEQISKEDIDKICITHIQNRIFDMVEAVANKQRKAALDYYYQLLELKEAPMRILFLLIRQYRLMMEVNAFNKQNLPQGVIAQKVGLPSFVVGKYLKQGRNLTLQKLKEIMELGAETEESIKTGRITDILGVEVFIVKCSMA